MISPIYRDPKAEEHRFEMDDWFQHRRASEEKQAIFADTKISDPYFPTIIKKEFTEEEIEELKKAVVGTPVVVIKKTQPRCTCWYDDGVVDYE